MTPRYAKLLLLVIAVLIIYKTFQHYGMSEKDLETDPNLSQKVKISVYYEALCPDSKFFIKYQLLPVFEEFYEHIVLDLVPYGKAQVNFVTMFYIVSLRDLFSDYRIKWYYPVYLSTWSNRMFCK